MSHRDPQVQLAAAQPRCEPTNCPTRRWSCARYLAPIQAQGASMDDFSLRAVGGWCMSFVSVSAARAQAQRPANAEVKVHDAPRGLL